ncbi:ABC-three component system middle component 5 [Pseudomonas aeruginosa]|uniref:ABC-three component system middle component 5 n=1 Tax=Pseudomonas aeruginosa TaxID=287 RepID=UPI00106BDA24|nr:ABC-three component system middle component 5 [Pseudomonas aeruginosa]
MLLYNKAFDPIHTVLRLVTICQNSSINPVEVERLQIFNFLLAFPAHIADMPLPREMLQAKNKFKKYRSPYNNFEPYTLFNRINPTFFSALQIAENIGFMKTLQNGEIELHKELIPAELDAIINAESSSIPKEALAFEMEYLSNMPILGKAGLKAASKLMDFKYDHPKANNQS